jgi:hypothetical protein
MAACGHRLCELVGEGCSLAVTRSRGCHASGWATAVAPELLDEVRALLARIDANDRAAAARLWRAATWSRTRATTTPRSPRSSRGCFVSGGRP